MSELHNVGRADSIIRQVLGVASIALIAYHFLVEAILPIYGLILVVVLIAFFLKTGYTKVCPIMKAMNVSTLKKEM